MAVAKKWQRYRRQCQHCRAMFGCWRATQRYCSRACHAADRPEHQRKAGRAGGVASATQRLARMVAEIRAVWPGIPDEAVRTIWAERRRWWLNGYRVGHRAGRRAGFAEACGETTRRRRAA